ncbi:protein of unknown function [Bradyrhizobium vignae]|uniref:Uncharacterized protein n=1 Tax=Bradyrhizobium vignae TaxID=1549949 RepID=A0A2U3QAG5_9BRAD|nr:protein of unknown function [Bradyrhizobium vignae]
MALVEPGAQAPSLEDLSKSGRTGTSVATAPLVVRPIGPSRRGRAAGPLLTKSDPQSRSLKVNLWRWRAYL